MLSTNYKWILIKRNGNKYGPYSDKQLREYAAKGLIDPKDFVQRTDSHIFTTANQIKYLFPNAVMSEENNESFLETPKNRGFMLDISKIRFVFDRLEKEWSMLSRNTKIITVGFFSFLSMLFLCSGCMIGLNLLVQEKQNQEEFDIPRISAMELAIIYSRNEIRADSEFRGKKIEVFGVVRTIRKGIFDISHIELDGERDKFIRVKCSFLSNQKESLINVFPRRNITVRGQCEGLSMGNVRIKDCQLIND